MKTSRKNLILFLMVIALVIIPLVISGDAEFGGADGQAADAVSEMNPEYTPWFESLWSPPSGEIESLLFAVQASLGAGVIAYYFGYMKGKRKSASN